MMSRPQLSTVATIHGAGQRDIDINKSKAEQGTYGVCVCVCVC